MQIGINIWKMEVALFKLTLRNSIWARAPATNKAKIRTDIAENRIQNDNCCHTRCIYRVGVIWLNTFTIFLSDFVTLSHAVNKLKFKKKIVFLNPFLHAFSLYEKCRRLLFFILLKSKNRIKLEEGIKFNFYYRGGAQETTIIVIHFPEY